ncbi:g-protein alpha subunit [Ancylostoma caninum]|uniref:G-protein alpha subunit n=1 Tax=Ancylostoma caninum TaxID=29170 RepID=A0A368EYX3_ANCCA|nr:g-protein alpha subunit [Ancylostoma caninum]
MENLFTENSSARCTRSGCEFIDWGPELRSAVRELWADGGIRKAYSMKNSFHISESAEYFFNELDRISKKNYKPSLLDILHTRVPTSGVVQFYFTMKGINFEVFDVGGQRSERRKWIHCFDNVNAVIYVAAISEYDQVLREDNKTVSFFTLVIRNSLDASTLV